jgi:hypothetical protein
MKKALIVGFVVGILFAPPYPEAQAGERVVCSLTMPTDAGAISTADELTVVGCPSSRLQTDGGIFSSDGGFTLTNAAGTANTDGGVAGCAECDWGPARSLALQCDNPVYYSERWDGGTNAWNQKGAVPATTSDVLVDFDINPDAYRVDLRGGAQHISVRSVSTSANVCKVMTIQRHNP